MKAFLLTGSDGCPMFGVIEVESLEKALEILGAEAVLREEKETHIRIRSRIKAGFVFHDFGRPMNWDGLWGDRYILYELPLCRRENS